MGVSSSHDTQAFAEEIFRTNLYKQQEQEAAILARKHKSYKADDEENVASQSKKTDKRVKRFRNKSENQDDDDAHLRQEKQAKHKASQDETDESESEEERLRDQQERE
ncbi:hypothetical protein Tco_0076445, partial [Tanacetum coccineum]